MARLNVRRWNDAQDEFSELRGVVLQSGDWFSDDQGDMSEAAPLTSNFDTVQFWRERSPDERLRHRFDVHLWATVDWRKSVYGQVAAQLRSMATFLNEQAASADEKEEQRQNATRGAVTQ